MKKLSKRFRAFLLAFGAAILTALPVQADPTLVGYWTFDDSAVTESSGYAAAGSIHNGTIVGTGVSFLSPAGEAGAKLTSGNYISFTGDTYAVIDNTANNDNATASTSASYVGTYDFHGANYTISTWVKGLPDGAWEPYISKYGENNYGYQLRRQGESNNPCFTIRRTGGDDDPYGPGNLNDGSWHQLTAVYGGTYRELYMDGVLQFRIPDTAVSSGGEGESLVFGARNHGGADYQSIANISLDDVAIFSGALNPNEVKYIAEGNSPMNGFASVDGYSYQYNLTNMGFAESNGNMLPASKNLTTGSTIKNSIFYGADFNNTSKDYITLPLTTETGGLSDSSFTVSAWVNLDSTTGDQSVLGNTGANGTNTGLHLIVRNGKPLMGFYGNDTTGNATINTGEWYYLTWQYDKANQTQTIYVNGVQDSQGAGHTPFMGTGQLTVGAWGAGGTFIDGRIQGLSITNDVVSSDVIAAQYAAGRKQADDFTGGISPADWTQSCGFGSFTTADASKGLCPFSNPDIYGAQGNTSAPADDVTGIMWGPQFKVLDDTQSINVTTRGGYQPLVEGSRTAGGSGIALWDMDAKDFVRDNGVIRHVTNTSNDATADQTISLAGLEGKNIMLTILDRQAGGWAWTGLKNLSMSDKAVEGLNPAAHSVALQSYDFDTAGDFQGWHEVDPTTGEKLDTITHFTLGNLGADAQSGLYVDSNGTHTLDKGFLSSGYAGMSDSSTGVIRSSNFLVQGDVVEFLIAGGKGENGDLQFELVNANTNEVLRSASGTNANIMYYDYWSLAGIDENTPVYLQVKDNRTANWAHLEIDQVRQVLFAPTSAQLTAANNSIQGLGQLPPPPDGNPEAFLVETFRGEGQVPDLATMDTWITGTPVAIEYRDYLNLSDPGNTGGPARFNADHLAFPAMNAGDNDDFVVRATGVIEIPSAGMYTFGVNSDDGYRLTINGQMISENVGVNDAFLPILFDEAGWYDLELDFYERAGGAYLKLFATEGAFSSWVDSFALVGSADGLRVAAPNYVPEPATWLMLILGSMGIYAIRRRKTTDR